MGNLENEVNAPDLYFSPRHYIPIVGQNIAADDIATGRLVDPGRATPGFVMYHTLYKVGVGVAAWLGIMELAEKYLL